MPTFGTRLIPAWYPPAWYPPLCLDYKAKIHSDISALVFTKRQICHIRFPGLDGPSLHSRQGMPSSQHVLKPISLHLTRDPQPSRTFHAIQNSPYRPTLSPC